MPDDYPDSCPITRIKNLTPDILDNNRMLLLENMIRDKCEESIGAPMIYELTEVLREHISDMNDKILQALEDIKEKDSISTGLSKVQ